MIRVLVVDDSAVAREYLTQVLGRDPRIQVVGVAADGLSALEAVRKLRPDLITMDIHMPRMDGPTAIRQIMETQPTPIVVVTGNEITAEVRATFESLDMGALAVVPRPGGGSDNGTEDPEEHLIRTVKLMAEVKVVRRWARPAVSGSSGDSASPVQGGVAGARVVVMGASTGGPTVLKDVLLNLLPAFPLPMVIVQHIAPGFVTGFAAWLRDSTQRRVEVASQGLSLEPGCIYVAPDGRQLGFGPPGSIQLHSCQPGEPHCPSVTYTFRAAAAAYGAEAVGVLLTGMGRDGAEGLLALRQAGALTVAQDPASSVVFGMPAEAIRLRAANLVLAPDRIAATLNHLTTVQRTSS